MDSYTATTLVGGAEGDFFSDIQKLTDKNGECRNASPLQPEVSHLLSVLHVGQLVVAKQNAIRRIDVFHGWVVSRTSICPDTIQAHKLSSLEVDGLGVWYKVENSDEQVSVEHGSHLTGANEYSSVKLAGKPAQRTSKSEND